MQEPNTQNANSQPRRGQNSQTTDGGDLNGYNNDFLLTSFHEDAIKQASLGKFQFIATLIVGLGLSSHSIQGYSVFYVEASAEIEYCIVDIEKNWLGM